MNEEHSHAGSVPLIPLSRRREEYDRLSDDNDHDPVGYNYHGSTKNDASNNPFSDSHEQRHGHSDLDDFDTSYRGANPRHQYNNHNNFTTSSNMAGGPMMSNLRQAAGVSKKGSISVMLSYAFDWVVAFAFLGVAAWWNGYEPNRRPFSLEDRNISFPFTEHETIPPWLLVTLVAGIPIISIPIICLFFVPGRTVPPGTPKGLVWRRKLWELHIGWLGLAFALAATWFVTNGTKNMLGKPRPDLLDRCNPDVDNFEKYVVGGVNVADGFQRLVSADICRGKTGIDDPEGVLQDGFRSFPSGHSSSAAAGLIYLTLFIASKFAITFPFLPPGSHTLPSSSFTAFPSRRSDFNPTGLSPQNLRLTSVRRQAAAPPLWLLVFAAAPFSVAVMIACTRWFDFRHHAFDILSGFTIGTVSAFAAFRWYHLPISRGAGWAWGPRCADKAWWAGVGSSSYGLDWEHDVGIANGGEAPGGAAGMGTRGRMDDGIAMEEGMSHKAAMSMGSDVVPNDGGDMSSRRRI